MNSLALLICLNILSIFGNSVVLAQSKYKWVVTSGGIVKGIRNTTLLEKVDFYSFKGIPYAQSPTGDLRFKAPKPAKPWFGIRDALEHGKVCYRPTPASTGPAQSEDCLFLNVYTPADVKPFEKLPVIVFVHGGAYAEGNGNDDVNGPDFLLEQRVVFVTFNYRLGVFGFLSFNTTEYSGNNALKDQQLAIKWIHENIANFSGDNKRITLLGESAGATMVHLHVLSSESRKYFRNAISFSGVAQNPWSLSKISNHLEIVDQIAQDYNLSGDLIESIKALPSENISVYGDVYHLIKRTEFTLLAPVIERPDAKKPFLTEYPDIIYNNSKIKTDIMFGGCSVEMLPFFAPRFPEIYDINGLDTNFTVILPFQGERLPFDSEEYQDIASQIRKFYFKNATIDETQLKPYIDLISNMNYAYGIDKAVKTHATKTKAKSYYFRFSVDTPLNVFKSFYGSTANLAGAGHGDNLCYMFRCNLVNTVYDAILSNPDAEQSKAALNAIKNLTTLFSNFAKYGTPTKNNDPIEQFPPVKSDQVNYLNVTNSGLVLGVNLEQTANALWADIEQKVRGTLGDDFESIDSQS